jgi:exo-beta-1,3-glucanase (GH17 family)
MKTYAAFFVFVCVMISCCDCHAQKQTEITAKDILGNPDYLAFSYGGYRGGDRNTVPTVDQLKEDMRILSAMGVRILRTYNTQQFQQAPRLLEAIDQIQQEDPDFEMYVMLGAWIDCKNAWKEDADHDGEDEANNAAEIEAAVALANRYPKSVKMISVGNECMVRWATNYFVSPKVVLKWVNHLQGLKENGKLPSGVWITSSDNFASWGGDAPVYHKPELTSLLKAVDFVSMHTYPFHDTHYESDFWIAPASEGELSPKAKADAAVRRAIDRAKMQYKKVADYMAGVGVDKPIHIGETGWASTDVALLGPSGSKAADEYKARVYYALMRAWTNEKRITCFYFEAFDEKWKDKGNADGSENHFGLIDLEGRAKYAIWNLVDSGAFKGLTRGGNPITKTHGGDEATLMATLLPVPSAGNWDGTILPNENVKRELGNPVAESVYVVFHETITPQSDANAVYPSKPIKLNVWEGTCELERVESEMHVRTGTGDWWGCALEIQSKEKGEDLTRFENGKLRFEIRGSTRSCFKAGFQTGRYANENQTNNGALFGPEQKYEISDMWKSFEIPIRDLIQVDSKANLKNVTSALYLMGEKDFDGKEIQLRNVTWTAE